MSLWIGHDDCFLRANVHALFFKKGVPLIDDFCVNGELVDCAQDEKNKSIEFSASEVIKCKVSKII